VVFRTLIFLLEHKTNKKIIKSYSKDFYNFIAKLLFLKAPERYSPETWLQNPNINIDIIKKILKM